MKPSTRRFVIAAALLGAAVAVGAQVGAPQGTWKWRDAGGQIVVSDMPPPASVPEKSIIERPAAPRPRPVAAAAPVAPAASAPPGKPVIDNTPRVDPELEARRKAAANEQAAQQKAEEQRVAAARAENCTRARSQLTALADGQRMTRTNEKGEREVLDDKGRAEEMQRARTIIATDCK